MMRNTWNTAHHHENVIHLRDSAAQFVCIVEAVWSLGVIEAQDINPNDGIQTMLQRADQWLGPGTRFNYLRAQKG